MLKGRTFNLILLIMVLCFLSEPSISLCENKKVSVHVVDVSIGPTTVHPGDTVYASCRVKNNGTVKTVYVVRGSPSWILSGYEAVILKPGGVRDVLVRLHVNESLAPGRYSSSLVLLFFPEDEERALTEEVIATINLTVVEPTPAYLYVMIVNNDVYTHMVDVHINGSRGFKTGVRAEIRPDLTGYRFSTWPGDVEIESEGFFYRFTLPAPDKYIVEVDDRAITHIGRRGRTMMYVGKRIFRIYLRCGEVRMISYTMPISYEEFEVSPEGSLVKQAEVRLLHVNVTANIRLRGILYRKPAQVILPPGTYVIEAVTPEGYAFAGWGSANEGGPTPLPTQRLIEFADRNNERTYVTIAGNGSIYASFTPIKIVVLISPSNGTVLNTPTVRFKIRAVDYFGKPLKRITVRLELTRRDPYGFISTLSEESRTDDEGYVEFEKVLAEGVYLWRVVLVDYGVSSPTYILTYRIPTMLEKFLRMLTLPCFWLGILTLITIFASTSMPNKLREHLERRYTGTLLEIAAFSLLAISLLSSELIGISEFLVIMIFTLIWRGVRATKEARERTSS